jgi:membrane fusion protein (multidrug efflux system)
MRDGQLFEVSTEAARAGEGLERLRISSEHEPSTGGRGCRIVVGLATIAAFGVATLAWDRHSAMPWSPRPAALSPETTIIVLRDPRSQELVTAGGYAVTQSKIHLGSQLTGKIKRLAVDKGDRVKAGDLIAELENESYQIEATRAKADAGLAKANADRYRKHIDRMSELYRRQSISRDELEEARRLAETSSLSYEVAEARRAAALCEYNKTFIRSPMSGVVVKKFLNVGDTVSPMIPYTENMDTLCTGSPIVSLVDPSDIEIEVDVSEDAIAKVRLGQSADVIPTVHPDPRLKAEVCRIGVEANRKKHAIQVELRLKEPVPDYLKPEVEVKVNISCDGAEGGAAVLLLDRRAVLQKDGTSFAYVVEHGRAVLRSVDLTHGDETHFQVLRGVREGDRLILNPSKDWPNEVAVRE